MATPSASAQPPAIRKYGKSVRAHHDAPLSTMNHRRSIRLKSHNYSSPGYYFITICTHNRQNILGNIKNKKMILNKSGKIVNEILLQLPERYPNISLSTHQIMPNHIHIILQIVEVHSSSNVRAHHNAPLSLRTHPGQKRALLPKCIGYLKMNTTKMIRASVRALHEAPLSHNAPLSIAPPPIWQRNYYEHIIRTKNDLIKIKKYIKSNPAMRHRDRNNINTYALRFGPASGNP